VGVGLLEVRLLAWEGSRSDCHAWVLVKNRKLWMLRSVCGFDGQRPRYRCASRSSNNTCIVDDECAYTDWYFYLCALCINGDGRVDGPIQGVLVLLVQWKRISSTGCPHRFPFSAIHIGDRAAVGHNDNNDSSSGLLPMLRVRPCRQERIFLPCQLRGHSGLVGSYL
jgi:hypothetical protein